MKDYQNDKYENIFLHLKASREVLAKFADFTATAVTAPGVDVFIAGHGAALTAAVGAMRAGLVTRLGQGGSAQTGTSAEEKAFEHFKEFIQMTNTKVLQPYLYDHADEEKTYYPDNLAGLTQAPVKKRGTRLAAYVKALQESADDTVKAQAAAAALLLKKYAKAATTKTKSRTDLNQTISDLGPGEPWPKPCGTCTPPPATCTAASRCRPAATSTTPACPTGCLLRSARPRPKQLK